MSDGSTGPTDDSPSLLTSILRASSASGSSRGLAPKLKASLDLLLLGLRPDEEYAEAGKELDRLAASVPKSSCGRGFQKGDVIWKCKTCAIGDDTCVVCQAPPRIHAALNQMLLQQMFWRDPQATHEGLVEILIGVIQWQPQFTQSQH